MRTGIFTAAELNALSGGIYRNYYLTNTPCQNSSPYCNGNTLNTADIDPGGSILINNLLPLPNANPANNTQGYNLITDLVTSDPRNQETLKMDYDFSERVHLSGRYNHENENVPAPYGPYNTINFAKIPYPAAQEGRNASDSINFNLTNTFNQTLTNALSVSYTRFRLRVDINDLGAVSRSASGYPYANVYPGSDVLPNVSFTNASGAYIPGGETPPFSTIQNTTTVNDAMTKVLGRHLLQFGFYGTFATYNNLTTGNDNGTVASTAATYVTGTTGNEFSDLLVGLIAGYSQSSSNVMANMVNKRFDFFGEDTWKANSRLTLNYGARWITLRGGMTRMD